MARWIAHIDMDAFYASVEQLDNPKLAGKPVIVGAPPDKRGVVSAASYEAREHGVHSAMPSRTAFKKCPHGIFRPVRMDRYVEVSHLIRAIFESYTPLVEPLSLDEAFLDLTGSGKLHGPPDEICRDIRRRIKDEIGITASVGLAPNKFLAKMASDMDKPNGFVVIEHGREADAIKGLPISRLWGVGKATEKRLKECGFSLIGDIASAQESVLEKRFGPGGKRLHQLANGVDDRPVEVGCEVKSVSNETTYSKDVSDPKRLRRTLIKLAEKVGRRMRAQELAGKTVQLKLRFADFETMTRDRTLPAPIDSDNEIIHHAMDLFEAQSLRGKKVRLIGVGLAQITQADYGQLMLFREDEEKKRRLSKVVDGIRSELGEETIMRGSQAKSSETQESLD
ncbi:DNA polymerase IV [Candidatus Hydrogenedentota bacterium]